MKNALFALICLYVLFPAGACAGTAFEGAYMCHTPKGASVRMDYSSAGGAYGFSETATLYYKGKTSEYDHDVKEIYPKGYEPQSNAETAPESIEKYTAKNDKVISYFSFQDKENPNGLYIKYLGGTEARLNCDRVPGKYSWSE